MIAGRCQNPKSPRMEEMQHPSPTRETALRARPSAPLSGTVRAPADKSVSHRSLILGAMAAGLTEVEGLLEGEDVLATARCAASLGADVERTGPGAWRVTGAPGGLASPQTVLDFGNSGTGVRLMLGAAAGYALEARFDGDASLRSRPMERIAAPLRQMGAAFETAPGGRLPLTLRGGGLKGIAYDSPVASAQIKSAVLLAGLNAEGETTVREPAPSRDHTEQMLALFGAPPRIAGGAVSVTGGAKLTGARVTVPGDPSSAAFLAAAAVLTSGSRVVIGNVMTNPLRTEFFAVLARMGATLEWGAASGPGADAPADLAAAASGLTGVRVEDASIPAMIDEVPILAVCAAYATGVTRIEGLAELRVKESDRLLAVADLLRANGVDCETGEDWLEVEGRGPGGVPGGGLVETRHDHRIAMSALVLGLAAQKPVAIDDASMIATSYPDFTAHMAALGADVSA